MKKKNWIAVPALCIALHSIWAQSAQKIDLHQALQSGQIQVYNRTLTPIADPAYPGIHLNKAYGEGVAWLKGVELSDGTLEFDVRGENVKQHSFVGIAFHGQNDSTFDAVYLRPFQFRAADETLKKRSIQYISLPEFTWRALREKSPGKYENDITPAPDPDGWVHMRVVIKGNKVSTYINNSNKPCLVVNKVGSLRRGAVGFYVADTSGGDFANFSFTKTK